jgi:hypothetical protein
MSTGRSSPIFGLILWRECSSPRADSEGSYACPISTFTGLRFVFLRKLLGHIAFIF